MNRIESDRLLSPSGGSCFDRCGFGQYSSTNAWNVNFNNGNANNNTRTNTNYVRAFSELRYGSLDDAIVPFDTFVEAYLSCRKNKRNKPSAVEFEMGWTHKLYKLWREVIENRYTIGKSICFIVTIPVKREVFAANFRDRIIHHWIAIRLEPLLDGYLPDVMCSNRKGFGTSRAIELVYYAVNNPMKGIIYKFDIQGFFMSIDKRILRDRIIRFVEERYQGKDLAILLLLLEKVIMHCPQNHCIMRSPASMWNDLAKNKSLFNQDAYHGIAIGNLTSQMLANFYLSSVVMAIIRFGVIGVAQYVDDMFVKVESEEARKELQKVVETELAKLGLTIHKRKRYIQPCNHGVSFIGMKICKGRIYPGGRCVDRFGAKMRYFKSLSDYKRIKDVESFAESFNSYFGLLRMSRHCRTFRLRKLEAMNALERYSDCCFVKNNEKVVVKRRYTQSYIMAERIRNNEY